MSERLFAGACVALLFISHLLYGALTAETSLTMTVGWALLLATGAVVPWRGVQRTSPMVYIPYVCFGLTLLIALWTLTPYTPDGVQPVWRTVGLAGAATVDRSATILEIVKLLGLACAFSVGVGLGRKDSVALGVTKWIVYAGGALALLAIGLSATGAILQTQGHRLEAFFLNPNTAGTVFGAIFCMCAAEIFSTFRRRKGLRGKLELIAAGLCALLTFTALIMTNSRGALGSTCVALAVLLALQAYAKRWKLTTTLVIAGGCAAILAVMILAGFAVDRFGTVQKDAALRRLIFDTNWRAFREAPWTGHGLGTFDIVNRSRLTTESFHSLWNIRSAENVYLQWLVEGGVLGAGSIFLGVALTLLLTLLNLGRERSRAALHALIAVDAVIVLHGIFDFGLQTPSVAAFWAFLLGLQLSWASSMSSRRKR